MKAEKTRIALAISLPLIVCVIAALILSLENHRQKERNQILQNEIAKIDPMIIKIRDYDKKLESLLSLMRSYENITANSHVGFIRIIPQLSMLETDTVSLLGVGYIQSNYKHPLFDELSISYLVIRGDAYDRSSVDDFVNQIILNMSLFNPTFEVQNKKDNAGRVEFVIKMSSCNCSFPDQYSLNSK